MLLLFIPSKVAPPPSLRLAGLRGQGGVGQRSRCVSLSLLGLPSGVQWAKVIRKNETAKEKGKFSLLDGKTCPWLTGRGDAQTLCELGTTLRNAYSFSLALMVEISVVASCSVTPCLTSTFSYTQVPVSLLPWLAS